MVKSNVANKVGNVKVPVRDRREELSVAGVGGFKTLNVETKTVREIYQFAKETGESIKKRTVPEFLRKQWEAGNRFNKENRHRYPYNEVELEAKEPGGKKYVVDSYVPGKEIVSRKFTQLAEVQEKTALGYLISKCVV